MFIVGVLVIHQQLAFTQSKNLGYSRDNVMTFSMGSNNENPQVFLAALEQVPGVVKAGHISTSILSGDDFQGGYSWKEGDDDKGVLFQSPRIGYGAMETLGMELIAGRSFSKAFQDDDTKIILNESALKLMQLTDPIGKIIGHGPDEKEIIGVVRDFHYGSIHEKIEPLILRFREGGRNVLVKIRGESTATTLAAIEELYDAFQPGFPFEFTFLDEDYQRLYESENKVAVLSEYASGLAIIISCLGLFGLAVFNTERRSKEIGIRKVLGATVFGIASLLSRDFIKMVLIAILIALPISYLLAHRWLDNFAYRIELQGWHFLVAAGITLLIAWLTVGIQTWRAAQASPVISLRSE